MFSFFTCTCALEHFALCAYQNTLAHACRHVAVVWNVNRWNGIAKQRCAAQRSMGWHGMASNSTARHVMILDCHSVTTFLRLIKFVEQNDTYDHGCTGTHIFSSLANVRFSLGFLLLQSVFLFWPITLLYGAHRNIVCGFACFPMKNTHTRARAHAQPRTVTSNDFRSRSFSQMKGKLDKQPTNVLIDHREMVE